MAERKQTSRVADLLRKSVEAVAEKKANANCFGFMYEPKTSKIYFNWNGAYNNLTKLMITPYGSYGTDDSLKPAGNEYGATRECVVNRTGKYAVTNGVYERGYRYASLGVKSQSGNGTAKGVWSPDCAGSYTILN